jgi:hypothetical protein
MWPFGPKTSLEGVEGPTRLRLACRVASPNDVASPLTSQRVALVSVVVVERRSAVQGGESSQSAEWLEPVGTILFADRLRLAVEDSDVVLDVPLEAAEFRFADTRSAFPLEAVPPALREIVARAPGRGLLCFREDALLQGDRVELEATVRPAARGGAYRSAAGTFEIAEGPVTVEERLELPSW